MPDAHGATRRVFDRQSKREIVLQKLLKRAVQRTRSPVSQAQLLPATLRTRNLLFSTQMMVGNYEIEPV